ncbi:MAG: NYN domain-containing protein [Candidatus Magasanikbacteria bacterium]|nr:NYN domain-containing protein [Candidatus Magasanikbacteria bacterium]
MFKAKTERLAELAEKFPYVIQQLNGIFSDAANVYIDYANVIHWHKQLGWHVDIKRLKQLLDSFATIKLARFYSGTLKENEASLMSGTSGFPMVFSVVDVAARNGYQVCTKPVKIMRLSIDVSGIPENSPAILQNFVDKQLLSKMSLEVIAYLNNYLKSLNAQGVIFIEKRKCNFDVEIGIDILVDHRVANINTFALWSGDSDFAGPLAQIMNDGKKAVIFATARRVSAELKQLSDQGLFIFDIQKIKEFICFAKEMQKGSR